MSTKKIFAPLLLGILTAVSYSFAFGATSADISDASPLNQTSIPQIYVTGAALDKTSYGSGDTIKGSFKILNNADFGASGIEYEVILVGKFEKNGLPTKNYGSLTAPGSMFLGPKEQKSLTFSYQIPQGIGGTDMAIFIRTKLASGFYLGDQITNHFNISGGIDMLDTLYSSLNTRNKDASNERGYSLHAGPTIYQNSSPEVALARFTLKNSTKTEITVTPTLYIYDRTISGAKLYEKELKDQKVTIAAGKTGNDEFVELPNFSYKPGIYAGLIVFKDKDGIERVSRMDFRYIVAGDIYTIHAVAASKASLQKGDGFSVNVSYSGTPIDLYSGSAQAKTSQPAKVNVAIFNERDEKVAESMEIIDFAKGENHDFTFTSSSDAEAMRAEVSVNTLDGKSISNKDFVLSSDYDSVHGKPRGINLADEMHIVWVIGGVLVLLILVIIIKRGIHKNRTFQIFFVLVCGGALVANLYPMLTQAFVVVSAGGETYGWAAPTIYVSSPVPDLTYAPGQSFAITGHVTYLACTNSAYNTVVNIYNYDASGATIGLIGTTGSSVAKQDSYHNWRHEDFTFDDLFAVGTNAPVAPGNYHFVIISAYADSNGTPQRTTGYQNYRVLGPQGNPTGGGGGCGSGQFYCDIFRQCISNNEYCNLADPNYVPFKINPNIPASVGPVKLKPLGANPPIGKNGYTCRISWNDSFTSYDKDTHCAFTGTNASLSFDPASTTAPTFFDSGSLSKDTTYKMSCHEGEESQTQSSEATCRVNWNYKEVN